MFNSDILEFDTINSTNTFLLDNCKNIPNGTVVIANHQTEGRGRIGRNWVNEKDENLMFSVLFTNFKNNQLSLLPLITGLAVVNSIKKIYDNIQVDIKWPNDIIINSKKISGILCESRISSNSVYAVLGIGVNLCQNQDHFIQNNLIHGSSLFIQTNKKIQAIDLLKVIIKNLEYLIQQYTTEGKNNIITMYKEKCITLNKQVFISKNGCQENILAFAKDIGEDGQLMCLDKNNLSFEVYSGDVSVRGIEGYI